MQAIDGPRAWKPVVDGHPNSRGTPLLKVETDRTDSWLTTSLRMSCGQSHDIDQAVSASAWGDLTTEGKGTSPESARRRMETVPGARWSRQFAPDVRGRRVRLFHRTSTQAGLQRPLRRHALRRPSGAGLDRPRLVPRAQARGRSSVRCSSRWARCSSSSPSAPLRRRRPRPRRRFKTSSRSATFKTRAHSASPATRPSARVAWAGVATRHRRPPSC